MPETPPSPLDSRDAAEAWLLGRINYERVAVLPYGERQLKLDRMRQLLGRLGSPDAGLPIIHVAGTKGKGSTSAMLASILTAADFRVGVFSSPHLESIEERFSIDSKPISPDAFAALVERVRPSVEQIDADAGDGEPPSVGGPTFFDITTAMALVYFAGGVGDESLRLSQNSKTPSPHDSVTQASPKNGSEAKACDVVILEVGLGGRLDSTNVCLPTVSVITSISLDHTKQLGDTLAKIASEKAGIIKPGVPVVSGVTEEEPREVIARVAQENGCRLLQAERDYGHQQDATQKLSFWRNVGQEKKSVQDLTVGLLGEHQLANASVALATIGELQDQGWEISESACRAGLASVFAPGRVELLPGRPAVVIDTAHNRASARALCRAVQGLPAEGSRTLLVAISRDKDVPAIVRELAAAFDQIVVTQYVENPRAVEPEVLAGLFAESFVGHSGLVKVAEDPAIAWREAVTMTPMEGLVVVTGSFFIAAEVRPLAMEHSQRSCS